MKLLLPHLQYRWPVLLLLSVEAVALGWVVQQDGALPPVTVLSISAALVTLLVGLVPLVLRPSPITQLGALMIVVLAAFILVPVRPGAVLQPFATALDIPMPAYVRWRLINGALFMPLAYHVATHFPLQARPTACPQPSRATIGWAYLVPALIVLLSLLVSVPQWRLPLLGAMVVWSYLLVGGVVWRLSCISRDATPENGQARQQARVLLTSALLAGVPSLLLNGSELLLGQTLLRADFAAIFLVLLPIGLAYTVLRHDLLQIDGTIRRGLAYTALSALVLALYFVLTLLLTVGVARRQPELLHVVGAISVLLATFAFAPLQARIQQLVDRWLYPERRAFFAAVTAARETLGKVVDRAAVITLLTETVPGQIGAEWASLALAPAPLVPAPQRTPPGWQGVLQVGDTLLGRYWLGSRRTLVSYEADEQAALAQLLQEAALVLAYDATIVALRTLNLELEERVASRTAQVVAQQRALAAHEQRQQLARNLHDSVTQSLFSLNLSLRAIRKLGERDAEAAVAAVADQEAAAQQALGELRALLNQLRSEAGETGEGRGEDLMQRLRALGSTYEERGELEVQVQGLDTLALPAWMVEELTYLVREALHNVYKHSGQSQATVAVAVSADLLTLTVTDPGHGFDWPGAVTAVDKQAGYGLQGMHERTTHLGGTFTAQSAPTQGTTLTIQLPLPNHEESPRNPFTQHAICKS